MILGIETSCDETAAAVVTGDGEIRSSIVSSQAELHAAYGGVVPEIASRRHLELVSPVIREALDRGRRLARRDRHGRRHGRAWADRRAARRRRRGEGDRLGRAGCRSCPVNHLHGHVASLYLAAARPRAAVHLPARKRRPHAPARRAATGRGRASRVLGTTLDDAAGEAFDKGARLLGLAVPGRRRDRPARARGRSRRPTTFPVARVPGLDFSFSGLKTALLYAVRDLGAGRARRAPGRSGGELPARDRARARRADRGDAAPIGVAIVGGVAANSELRAALPGAVAAPLALCTDNAAMIASAARFTARRPGRPSTLRSMRLLRRPEALALVVARRDRRGGLAHRPPPQPRPRRRRSGRELVVLARPRRATRIRPSSLGQPDDRRPANTVGRPAARRGASSRPRRTSGAGRPRRSRPSSRC